MSVQQCEQDEWAPSLNGAECACSELWNAVVSLPGVGVLVVAEDGNVEYANQAAAALLGDPGDGPEPLDGRGLDGLLPPMVAETVIGHVRRVIESGEVVIERVMWRGARMQVQYQRLPAEKSGRGRAIVLQRRGVADPVADGSRARFTLVEPSYADFGRLDVLSPRELEVLAYLGQGLRIKEIAEAMGRSPKTVQNHRESIGHKLRVTDRLALAQIAREAGLEPADAGLTRLGPTR